MKIAYVYAVLGANTFTWSWRSADARQHSTNTFSFYFDCLQDAQKHGYTAEFAKTGPEAAGSRQQQFAADAGAATRSRRL